MIRTDTAAVQATIRRAGDRLNHPAVYGRHGLIVSVTQTLRGDMTLGVTLGERAIPLIRLKRERGIWAKSASDSMDVRVQAALDAIEPDLRALANLVPDLDRGIWNIVP